MNLFENGWPVTLQEGIHELGRKILDLALALSSIMDAEKRVDMDLEILLP